LYYSLQIKICLRTFSFHYITFLHIHVQDIYKCNKTPISTRYKLKELKSFGLSLKNIKKISERSLGHVAEGVLSLKSLEKFYLDTDQDIYTSASLEIIADGLNDNKNLKGVYLNLKNPKKMKDEGWTSLKDSISCMPCVKEFTFEQKEASKSPKFIDNIGYAFEGLKALKQLEKLRLSFGELKPKTKSKSWLILGEALKELQLLNSFFLEFYDCSSLSLAFAGFIEGYTSLLNLRELTVNIFHCDENHACLAMLEKKIWILPQLRYLRVCLKESPDFGMGPTKFFSFRDRLRSIKSIKNLEFEYISEFL